MIRPICLAAITVLTTAAWPAVAQSTLDRLEAVSTTMNAMMNEALLAEMPALDGYLPAPEWDAPLRTAYSCMHDAYVDEAGENAVADMVTAMETRVDTLTDEEILTGAIAVDNPDGITDDRAVEIVTDCRLIDAFMARMEASGMMEIMQQQQ